MTALPLVAVIVALALAAGGFLSLWEADITRLVPRHRVVPFLETERDLAAGLGWPLPRWVALRAGSTIAGLALGALSQVPLLMAAGAFAGFAGSRFLLAGRSAGRRLAVERAFLGQLRNLRDRMAVSNQPLDVALQEIGRNPGKDLESVLSPLARGGSVVANIVECGERSRSPLIEDACAVLLWARSRSLASIVEAIDEVLLPVGEAQLSVEEESLVTLAQQRAVTIAMALLMLFMLAVVIRVESFSAYYRSLAGTVVLIVILGIFTLLVAVVGAIVRTATWTRWDLGRIAAEQERLGG